MTTTQPTAEGEYGLHIMEQSAFGRFGRQSFAKPDENLCSPVFLENIFFLGFMPSGETELYKPKGNEGIYIEYALTTQFIGFLMELLHDLFLCQLVMQR